jgi:hypothetical protein
VPEHEQHVGAQSAKVVQLEPGDAVPVRSCGLAGQALLRCSRFIETLPCEPPDEPVLLPDELPPE